MKKCATCKNYHPFGYEGMHRCDVIIEALNVMLDDPYCGFESSPEEDFCCSLWEKSEGEAVDQTEYQV